MFNKIDMYLIDDLIFRLKAEWLKNGYKPPEMDEAASLICKLLVERQEFLVIRDKYEKLVSSLSCTIKPIGTSDSDQYTRLLGS